MNIVERVIALEGVDAFCGLTPDQLARIAAIATVEKFEAARVLASPSAAPEAVYVILNGAVELARKDRPPELAEENATVGVWALIDDAPLPLTATTVEETTALRIAREDFTDLLSDNVEMMATIFRNLLRRQIWGQPAEERSARFR